MHKKHQVQALQKVHTITGMHESSNPLQVITWITQAAGQMFQRELQIKMGPVKLYNEQLLPLTPVLLTSSCPNRNFDNLVDS